MREEIKAQIKTSDQKEKEVIEPSNGFVYKPSQPRSFADILH